MEQAPQENIILITSLILFLLAGTVIVLFVVFQQRKNLLLREKAEEKKRYEQEIAETQIEIREETLRNISWELHDNIGQLLTLAKIQLQEISCDDSSEVSETISKSLNEIRSLSKLINPEFINKIKLKEALQLEIDRFNRLNYINASLIIKGKEKEINQKHGIIIFRILQEFFSNTIKHSKASKLEVVLCFTGEKLNITANDDGIGFEIDRMSTQGIGIQNIKTRARLIHAEANLASKPQKGTILTIIYYF